jgi:hypothetical protein
MNSYNIAFANSERWLAKSRVDITQCQHGKFLSLYLFVLYIIKNIKHFFRIDSYINTRGNWENSNLCENTPPSGRRVSTQFLVFPVSTRVDITVRDGPISIPNTRYYRYQGFEVKYRYWQEISMFRYFCACDISFILVSGIIMKMIPKSLNTVNRHKY